MDSTPQRIGQATYELRSETITATHQDVMHLLLDGRNNLRLHPLLVDVQQVGQDAVLADGTLTRIYKFTDKMRICGLVPFYTHYTGQMWHKPGESEIRWRAKAGLGVTIEHTFSILPAATTATTTTGSSEAASVRGSSIDRVDADSSENNPLAAAQLPPASVVVQRTWVRAPRLLLSSVTSTARAAHEASLQRLPTVMAALSSSTS